MPRPTRAPAIQRAFYHLTNDLPARKSAWTGPELTDDIARAFYAQLQDARPAPAVPEWEQVAARLGGWVEQAVYGRTDVKSAPQALALADNLGRACYYVSGQLGAA